MVQNPSHLYSSTGSYTVSLTATNVGGSNTTVKSSYVNISVCPNLPVRIVGKASYSSLQAAYDASVDGDIIQAQAQVFYENFVANRSVSVTIDGGNTCDYSSNQDKSIIVGVPQIAAGTVTLENMMISN